MMDAHDTASSAAFAAGSAVEVVNLTKHYGQTLAVDNISFAVPRGEIFGFLGLNGAGKTTTIKVLAGLLEASYNSITIAGHDLHREQLQVKASIGVVMDEPVLYDQLTGYEFLEFAGAMYGLQANTLRPRLMDMLALVGLTEQGTKLIADYSRGMYQRLSLAAALMHKPQVLFLDEPFTGIDALGVHEMKDMLRKHAAEGGTVFFSSHIMELVENLCTSLAIIHKGRIISIGTLASLRAAHHGESLEHVFLTLIGENNAAEQAAGSL
jgi:ABC-2 type transport system ATP-binding protein